MWSRFVKLPDASRRIRGAGLTVALAAALLFPSSRANGEVISLTLGIRMNCPYGLAG
jgi:hypothetical protein